MDTLKVVIADDEERICRLIEALADWEALGLVIAGEAGNGLEACSMVERIQPDILITDIRMPGCSGLELIERVKEKQPDLEIIIISGYAHFEYAQQAIKYGVGEYLLKPVGRAELTATLKKLRERIWRRIDSEKDRQKLAQRAEEDDQRLRQKLVNGLFEGEQLQLSEEILRERYHLQVKSGLYQPFCLKMDCGRESSGDEEVSVVMEKAEEILERNLREKCSELVIVTRGSSCMGILNYAQTRRGELRAALKNCLGKIEMQKNLFHPVHFSMAAGSAVSEPEALTDAVQETKHLIWERLVKGTGRLFERMGPPSGLCESSLLDQYLRRITHAAEVMSVPEADCASEALLEETQRTAGVRGYEVWELVSTAADLFAARIQTADRKNRLEQFRNQIGQCSSSEELFACLTDFQRTYIQELARQHENDSVRPVRQAKQYIQNHYREPVTLEAVSERVGLSAAYFSALFKKTEGEGFAKYLINVRMERAKELLRETNLPVTEICRQVGYNDLKHFTHTFEKAAGVKPSTYRKLYG